jgi:hypothetical protein
LLESMALPAAVVMVVAGGVYCVFRFAFILLPWKHWS